MKFHWRTNAAAAAALAVLSFAPDSAAAQSPDSHVIVISIDGLRPDAIESANARVLLGIMAEGSYSLTARTISPSRTLPSHTSMLTGVPPAEHGITWNDDRTAEHGTVAVPTVFQLAAAAGLSTAAFFSKSKLRHLQQPGALDHSQAPAGLAVYSAAETTEQAIRYMERLRPNLLFIHIAEPDVAGHSTGWMGLVYRWAVRRADAAVGEIVRSADAVYGPGGYTLIVTADHGGHARTHGQDGDDDMHIPWIAWGAKVRQVGELTEPVSTMDTAATVLWLLGLEPPAGLTGRPVAEALVQTAVNQP